MNEQLLKKITTKVVEELNKIKQQDRDNSQPIHSNNERPRVQLYNSQQHQKSIVNVPQTQPLVQLFPKKEQQRNNHKEYEEKPIVKDETCDVKKKVESRNEIEKENRFIKTTPARVAVGRAGSRPRTSTWLKFRFDHAAAVDAVYGEVSKGLLKRLNLFEVSTKVTDKEEYIRRPDLGRRLTDKSKTILKERCQYSPTVQIVASNGLSASAVEENLEDVYLSLQQSLNNLGIDVGTSFYVNQGRVALMDDIGEVLNPEVVIMLIGERPGLVSAESLSAYLCYKPRHGTIEADRMVISNIHKGGIPPIEAGAYLGTVIQKVLKYQASGVSLVQKEG